MVDVQAAQVGELAEVLVLQGDDAEVTQAEGDQAAQVRQSLSGDGRQVAALYREILQPQQP